MELKYVMEFVELVNVGKFSEAAERLYISQSSLSKHMKVLEEDLGVPLFERETKRKVILSTYGKLYYPYAEQISILQQEYLALQRRQRRETAEMLSIGSIPAMAQYQITDILAKFQAENPGVVLNVEEMESSISTEKILREEIDFAFIREDTHQGNKELEHLPYTSDTLCAVLPASHPLAGRQSLALLELRDEKFLLLRDSSFMYDKCIKECQNAGFIPNVVYTGSQGENIVKMASQGAGIALLTRKPIEHLKSDQIVMVDIMPQITTEINLIYNKRATLSPASLAFLSFFREQTA
jgi:DNA-binding transcriptional LysR family regulator